MDQTAPTGCCILHHLTRQSKFCRHCRRVSENTGLHIAYKYIVICTRCQCIVKTCLIILKIIFGYRFRISMLQFAFRAQNMVIPLLHIHQFVRFRYNIRNCKAVLRVDFHCPVGKRRTAFQSILLILSCQYFQNLLYTFIRTGQLFPINCHNKLITAQTENNILETQTTPGSRRDKLKHSVTCPVSITVIYPIQTVNIKHCHCQRLFLFFSPFYDQFQPVLAFSPAGYSCQSICCCQLPQLPVLHNDLSYTKNLIPLLLAIIDDSRERYKFILPHIDNKFKKVPGICLPGAIGSKNHTPLFSFYLSFSSSSSRRASSSSLRSFDICIAILESSSSSNSSSSAISSSASKRSSSWVSPR